MGISAPLKSCKTSIFKKIRKIFNPMAIIVRRISLTEEKLHFLRYSVRGVIHALIDILGHLSVICNHEIFVKSNLPAFIPGEPEKVPTFENS